MKLAIREEFRNLLPKQSDAELEGLEASILTEGCREPIVYWTREGVPVVVDGHTRYSICHKNNLPYSTQEVSFLSDDDAKQWILTNQIGRRNLSPKQKEAALAQQLEYRGRLGDALEPPVPGKITMKEAKAAGVSNDTASKLNTIAQKSPELLGDIASGAVSVNKAHKKAVSEIEEVAQATELDGDLQIAGDMAGELKDIKTQFGALSLHSELFGSIETRFKGSISDAIKLLEGVIKIGGKK